MTKPLVILGDSLFAEIAYEYFSQDSDYEVVGFSVEAEHLKRSSFMGLPVVPFEKIENYYLPQQHAFFAAVVYTQGNQLRERLYHLAKIKGYRPASYISSKAFVWRNCQIGEHCFIFEDNTIQPFVKIGDNVVLWSGNHIGHHSIIDSHVFISSHVVVSGNCYVGPRCFLGVNSTIINDIQVGEDCLIAAGATVFKNIPANHLVLGENKLKKMEVEIL